MKKFIEVIKQKWIRQTTLTFLLIVILVAIFIVLNVWLHKMELTPIDITPEKLYTLSDESKNQVKDINQEVKIYFFGFTEDNPAVKLAKQYNNVNDKITAEIVKVTERPDLAQEYGIDSDESTGVVVQAQERNKVLTSNDFYTYDTSTYETIDITEQKLTNAIIDTTISKKPKVYFLTGHNEYQLQTDYITLPIYIQNEVNEVESLDLLTNSFPEDCDCLIIASPEKDFSDLEVEKITNYINNGGNILWMNDAIVADTNLPNVQKILDLYGVKMGKGIVLEQDTSKMILDNPEFVKPDLSYHEITKDIQNSNGVLMIDAGVIEIAETETLESLNVTSNPFITTSADSFIRTDLYIQSTSKSEGDGDGGVTTGAELIKKINDEKSSKLIIYSNCIFSSDKQIPVGTNSYLSALLIYDNKDLILNSIAYLTNREDAIRIRKDTGTVTYTATAKQDTVIRVIIFTVPFVIILIGIIVWQIRRRKR